MTMNSRKNKLLAKLKNKEYRHAFVSEYINEGIPFQIRTLRNQRGLTQTEFGKLAGKSQVIISRLENPNYASFSIATLKELAYAFDVGLIVRFVPISDLVKWDINLSSESLRVQSFDEESYFQEKVEETTATSSNEHITPHLPEPSNKVVNLKDRGIANQQEANFEQYKSELIL